MGLDDEAGVEEIQRQKDELEVQRKALEDQKRELDEEKERLAQTKIMCSWPSWLSNSRELSSPPPCLTTAAQVTRWVHIQDFRQLAG